MKNCSNCVYKTFCYGFGRTINTTISCSGYVKEINQKKIKKTKEK